MKIMIQSTNVRLPKAPTVRPMIDISKFSVGQDFASLKTLNWKKGEFRCQITVGDGEVRQCRGFTMHCNWKQFAIR